MIIETKNSILSEDKQTKSISKDVLFAKVWNKMWLVAKWAIATILRDSLCIDLSLAMSVASQMREEYNAFYSLRD